MSYTIYMTAHETGGCKGWRSRQTEVRVLKHAKWYGMIPQEIEK